MSCNGVNELAKAVIMQAYIDATANKPEWKNEPQTEYERSRRKWIIYQYELSKKSGINFLCGATNRDVKDLAYWCEMAGRQGKTEHFIKLNRKKFKERGLWNGKI